MGVERTGAVLPTTTRAVVFHRPDDLRLESIPVPRLGPGDVLVRIAACGLCASEVMDWYMARKAPIPLGHEPVGEVLQTGPAVDAFAPGDRVFVHHHAPCMRCRACRRGAYVHCTTWRRTTLIPGGLAEFAVAPAEIVAADMLAIPPEMSDEAAIFIEPLATVVKSLRRGGLREGDRVLVIGLGVMGLLHVMMARRLGAQMIVGADRVPSRLERAREAGADAVVDVATERLPETMRAAGDGDGADIVIVCPGSLDALQTGVEAAGAAGTVVVFTPTAPELRWSLSVHDLFFREVRIVPSYSCGPDDTRAALRYILEGLSVESLITHRLPLEEAGEGYRLVRAAGDALKVVVRP
ncbi:MAG: alcohol dehydrogenase catalytic domain-containing protein [bacterium]